MSDWKVCDDCQLTLYDLKFVHPLWVYSISSYSNYVYWITALFLKVRNGYMFRIAEVAIISLSIKTILRNVYCCSLQFYYLKFYSRWYYAKLTQKKRELFNAYVEVLQSFVASALNSFPQLHGAWFQQDGATSHTARQSMAAVRELFGNHVISRFGDIPWPPRSPDLSVCDFFLVGPP